jgi:hypothetical protein
MDLKPRIRRAIEKHLLLLSGTVLDAVANDVMAELEAKSEPQHSPLPWKTNQFGNIDDANGALVAAMGIRPQEKANRDFILRACNSHEAAVRLANLTLKLPCRTGSPLHEAAREFLAAAGEQP